MDEEHCRRDIDTEMHHRRSVGRLLGCLHWESVLFGKGATTNDSTARFPEYADPFVRNKLTETGG
jgi:hypothetical protein